MLVDKLSGGRSGNFGAELEVLDELSLRPWFDALSAGLDTELTGDDLSAGQAQLLAFARIFLRDPGLVVLDEASSRLDPVTEALLERAVDRLLQDRTGIIIAHRLSSLMHADEIVFLEGVRIVERGSHDELIAADGRYAALYRLQTKPDADAVVPEDIAS